MTPDDELVQAFLEESSENLDQLDLDLVALEGNPRDPELLSRVFRTVHTIKGTCGFLEYTHLEALSHAGEDLLAQLRDGGLVLDEAITTSLLLLVDEIRDVLAVVERTGTEGDSDHAEVIATLRSHLEPAPIPVVTSPPPSTSTSQPGASQPSAGQSSAAQPATGRPTAHEETSVRIDVAVLDQLQDLVGELTLARLRIADHIPDDGALAQAFHQLSVTTRDLQDTVMQARLHPLSTVTDRLRRIVRDLAGAQGKQVHLLVDGDDVAVDKAINEILRDPLVHLVRNAVDHGIETPGRRQAVGKPVSGTLVIEAAVVGGGVQIEISDDGQGVDAGRLVERSIAAGRLTSAQAAVLTESERLSLLFLPGVSTAAEVTTVSGRGVGMDVVRNNLEQVGGSIEVSSKPGIGTSFRISVPLTLAILPAIVVSSGHGRFTIAQTDVHAIVRVARADLDTRVTAVGEARFLHHHGLLLPLVDLADWLGTGSSCDDDGLEVVVIGHEQSSYGLIVDHVGDTVEAVVKPLPRTLRGLPHYSGVTVLSDGRPSLILEAAAPATAAGLHLGDATADEPQAVSANRSPILTVRVGDNRLGVPLDLVNRLVRTTADEIEHSGLDEVVQHHEEIVPLIRIASLLDLTPQASGQQITIVVCNAPDGPVGLVVDDVLDIEWADPTLAESVTEPCLIGRLVIAGKVTELVDLAAMVTAGLHWRRVTGGKA